MGRADCSDNKMNGLKKGPWSAEEDKILVEYIRHHGHGSWRALPNKAGLLRCGKSCRLRWTNYLRPGIKRGTFSSEEEQTIIRLHGLLGNKWSAIAGHLPGRTDNEIKNYWNTRLKKRLLQMGIDPVTHKPTFDVNCLRRSFNLDPCEMTGGLDSGTLEDELTGGSINDYQCLKLAAPAAAYSILMSENNYSDLCNMRPYWRSQISEYMNCCASAAATISADYNGALPLQQFILQQSMNNIPIIHKEDIDFPIENPLRAGAASELYDQKENYTVKEDYNSLPSTILQEAVLFNSEDEMPRSSTPADATQYCRLEDQVLSTVIKDEPKSLISYSSSHDMTNISEYPDLLSDINSIDSNCSYWEILPPEVLYDQGLQ